MSGSNRVGWAFGATALIWGTSFLFIKVALESLTPLQVAAGRLVVGAVTLIGVALATGAAMPRERRLWFDLFVVAFIYNSVPFAFFAFAETEISSVLAGIWNATTPLFTLAVVATGLGGERVTRAQLIGLGIGFAGVLVVLGPWQGLEGGALWGSVAALAAALCYGVGFPLTRRALTGRHESLAALMAVQILCGAMQLSVVSLIVDGRPAMPAAPGWWSMLGLGALGTGIAYILNAVVVRDAGASSASFVTYVIPIVSTTLGVVALDEHLSWNQPLGAVVVLAAVAVSQGRFSRRPAPLSRAS